MHDLSPGTGSLEVIAGCMFSGKSEELLRRVRRALIAKKRVQIFKSHLDDRYAGVHQVCSHYGNTIAAEPVRSSDELEALVRPDTQVVAIDEVQFLDNGIVDVVQRLADRGVRVLCAGLDMDFKGEVFGPIGTLLATAERVDKLPAVCVQCGEPATRNQRLINGHPAPLDGPTILVGAQDTYEARCRRCFVHPRTVTAASATST